MGKLVNEESIRINPFLLKGLNKAIYGNKQINTEVIGQWLIDCSTRDDLIVPTRKYELPIEPLAKLGSKEHKGTKRKVEQEKVEKSALKKSKRHSWKDYEFLPRDDHIKYEKPADVEIKENFSWCKSCGASHESGKQNCFFIKGKLRENVPYKTRKYLYSVDRLIRKSECT
jgi:hypothetical protein